MTRTLVDARGKNFLPFRRPIRVVSLVPSLTELLFDLGLTEAEVVGRTRFCVHPAGRVEKVPVVGGTKSFSTEEVLALRPELVLANREENPKEAIEEIEETENGPAAYVTDPTSLEEAVIMIRDLGVLVGRDAEAEAMAGRIEDLHHRLRPPSRGTALYLIWLRPYMCVAPGTYIHDMLRQIGFTNAISPSCQKGRGHACPEAARYPELSLRDMVILNPRHILLASEPFPFQHEHVERLRRELAGVDEEFAATVLIRLVEGEHYSWYGSRLEAALQSFIDELSELDQ